MGIDFTKLHAGFKEYLLQNGDITQEEFSTEVGSVSIFTHMDEFKDFLKSEYDCSDVSIFSMSINDILKMDIQDGKLIDPNAKTEDEENDDKISDEDIPSTDDNSVPSTDEDFTTGESEGTDSTGETSETTNASKSEGDLQNGQASTDNNTDEETKNEINLENIDLITNILNDLMQDDTIKGAIDTNTDGDISEDEIEDFLAGIKDYDKNSSDISLDDIAAAIKDIQEGNFNISEEEEEKEVEDKKESDKTEEAKETPTTRETTPTRSAASPSRTGSSGGGSVGANQSFNSQPAEKTLDNMSKEELNSELNTAQTDLTEKQNVLSAILDGSDPEISDLKTKMDDSFDEYNEQLKAVDEDMANQVNDLQEKINKKEEEIDKKDQEIADQENVVANAETAYNNAVSSRDNLKSIVSDLENANTSNLNSEQQAAMTSKIQDAKSQLEKAETAVDNAKETLDKEKEKLQEKEDEKTELISGDDDNCLNKLNEEMQKLETQIIEDYPEIKTYMDAYKSAKDNYETTKETKIEEAKSAIEKSQAYVDEVQTAITNFDNKEKARELSPIGDLQAAVDWARKYDDFSQEQIQEIFSKYGHQFDYNAWCADFVKMALYEGVGEENLPDWYKNIDNKAYCPTIQAHAQGHEISAEDAQMGDIVLYDWDGDGSADHVGLFVDNGDGSSTITAIEGNTSGEGGSSCVEEKARDRSTILGIYSMRK